MVGGEQVVDGGEQLGPGAGPGETGNVEVGGATLGIEEHRCGETGGEGGLADTLGPVKGETGGARDQAARDGHVGGGFTDGGNGHVFDESPERRTGGITRSLPSGPAGGGGFADVLGYETTGVITQITPKTARDWGTKKAACGVQAALV